MSAERRLRTHAALAAAGLALLWAAAAPAARITLVAKDAPNQGFNSTRPAQPLPGNPGRTLGEQRRKAFEAAAREWERLLVSRVEIEVTGTWINMDCDANSAVLAAAGPNFVFRDFPSAPLPQTWYVEAVANTLEGIDLEPGSGAELDAVFNQAIDGSPGCLGGAEWDLSIGTSRPAPNDLSFVDVVRHELGHGLGFLSVVDPQNGKPLLGFDDAFSNNLEDHSLRKTWGDMTDAQRRESAKDPKDLHWVGGGVQAAAQVLGRGFDEASGHVRMYAPPVLNEGSSVSHFDVDVRAKFDELMVPFISEEQELLVVQGALQDVGWPVDQPRLRPIADVDGDGADDMVVVRSDRVSGALSTVVVSTRKASLVVRSQYTNGYAPIDLAVMPNMGGTAADEVALLARNARQGAIQVFISDGASGQLLKTVGVDPQFTPLAMAVVPSFAGTPAAEIAFLAFRARDSATRVVIKDGSSGLPLRTLAFENGYLPMGMAVLPSFGGSPARELAVLVRRPDQGNQGVFVRDAASGAILTMIQLPADFRAQYVDVLPSFGGTPAWEVAVVGQGVNDGPARLMVFDASSGAELSRVSFEQTFLPTGLRAIADFGGSTAWELAVTGKRSDDRSTRVRTLDAATGEELYQFSLPATRRPLDLAVLPDYLGSPADELGLMAATVTDYRLRVFIHDPQSGAQLATVAIPFDGESKAVDVNGVRYLAPGVAAQVPPGVGGLVPGGSPAPADPVGPRLRGPRGDRAPRPAQREPEIR